MADLADRISVLLADAERVSADELLPLVYGQLRQLASARLARERSGQTLQATALVHEAFLRVAGGDDPGWFVAMFFDREALSLRLGAWAPCPVQRVANPVPPSLASSG